MGLNYLPLLQVQRDFYRLPRGPDRFRQYIQTMTDPSTGEMALPLSGMNPMGKEHLPAWLDILLELGAEQEAAQATAEAQSIFTEKMGMFKVCLVLSDDLHGGWTNRYAAEFSHRFEQKALYKRGWIVGTLWSSETPTLSIVREEILVSLFRADYVQRHGDARTLAGMLAQEGYAMKKAGITGPAIEADDLNYTREVLVSYLHCSDRPTLMAALFGDPAARELGYPPLGLSPRAGLALALSEANSITISKGEKQ